MNRNIYSCIRLHRAWTSLTSSVSMYRASTTSLSKLCQCFTIIIVKSCFVMFNLTLHSYCLKPFPLVISKQTLLSSLSLPYILKGCYQVYTSSFQQSCAQSFHPQACIDSGDFCYPSARPFISLCWASLRFTWA